MALVVHKFGGTSVGSVEKIKFVADKVISTRKSGDDVLVVVSAMSGETNRLETLAQEVSSKPTPRELDVLLATGEQVTMSLLAMALNHKGCPARSYTGGQVEIITDNAHNKARILSVNGDKIKNDLEQGFVVVVAGFQGVDEHKNITTLGRGGSDITAVAIAAALKAKECCIFTDVDGVYTTDPRVVSQAKRLLRITFEEMLEMASLGSKVLHNRSVELAGKYKIPLRVRSTFEDGPGTLITFEDKSMEQAVVSGIAFSRDEAKLTVRGVPDKPGIAGSILGPISSLGIEVDMIIQNASQDETNDFTFTVHRKDYEKAREKLEDLAKKLGAKEVVGDNNIVKISIVGVGMRSHAGIASKMFEILGEEGINIQMISTSEIKVSVVTDERYLELAVRALHKAFNLEHAE